MWYEALVHKEEELEVCAPCLGQETEEDFMCGVGQHVMSIGITMCQVSRVRVILSTVSIHR